MASIPDNPVAVEKLVRGLLLKLFREIDGLPKVYTHRLYIENETQAVKIIGYSHPSSKKVEYRVLLIDFSHVEETDDGQDDDCAIYKLVYTVKLVVSYSDERPDGTTSTDDFARFLLTMRKRVRSNRALAFDAVGSYPALDVKDLEPLDTTIYARDDETQVYGHSSEQILKVEVDPSVA